MATKLYVGNLSYETTVADLRKLFEAAGTVESCDLAVDRFSGKSRGFAFIEMASQADADEAVKQCHDAELDGRKLVVNEARPRFEAGGRDFGSSGSRGGAKTFRPSKGSRRGIRRAKRDRKAAW
ncbi:RNA-binding protein [Candidatus Fermentibacteria bacterium]|nr:RNA-binding protein [Candidatus Fermentibacteria bacterium]